MSNLLEKIRAETQSAHEELEQTLQLFEKYTSRQEYLEVLKKFFGFYSPLSSEISALGTEEDAEQVRLRASWLLEDFKSLGLSESQIALIPVCQEMPRFRNPNEVLGFRYVLEGSTLGGQVIRRHYRSLWQQEDDSSLRFFGAHGAETGRKWKAFVENLELKSKELTDAAQAEVVAGAKTTFEKLKSWLIAV